MKLRGGSFQGSFKGTLGNYTVYTRKGEQVLRMKQTEVSNPRSELQIAQRNTFKLATNELKKITSQLKSMYGEIGRNSEYSALMKLMLNSGICTIPYFKNKFRNNSSYSVVTEESFFKKTGTVVGKNYTKDGLNVFNIGEVFSPFQTSSVSNVVITRMAVLLNGEWVNPADEAPTGNFYFGCDYLLPDTIAVCCWALAYSNGFVPVLNPNKQIINTIEEISISINSDVVSSLDGIRNLGFFKNLSDVGSGWKYVYSINETNFNVLINSVLFSTLKMNWVDQFGVNEGNVYCYNIIFAVPSGIQGKGVQILSGVSANLNDRTIPIIDFGDEEDTN